MPLSVVALMVIPESSMCHGAGGQAAIHFAAVIVIRTLLRGNLLIFSGE